MCTDDKCIELLPEFMSNDVHCTVITKYTQNIVKHRGGTVVKLLCYKSEGRWFDPSWCHWNFSLT